VISVFILCYTREPLDEQIYDTKLAYSMHLAYSTDGVNFHALNHNSGVLFAKATHNTDGTMNAKTLRCPFLFPLADGRYGVAALRTEPDGGHDPGSRGKILLFTTADLLQYEEVGLLDLKTESIVCDLAVSRESGSDGYVVHWHDGQGGYYRSFIPNLEDLAGALQPEPAEPFRLPEVKCDIEGAVPRNVLEVPDAVGRRLVQKLTVPVNERIEVPDQVTASVPEEVRRIRATAVYSDGTRAEKPVDWDLTPVDWNKPGTYRVTGRVHQDQYQFPIAEHRADPCIIKWNGRYYFTATNDADHNHTIFIREADTIPGLVTAPETLILDSSTYDHIGSFLWAPEFHVIEGKLYIFHAASPNEFYRIESHVMKLRPGGNPACAADWSEPRRVVRRDGSELCESGKVISLDMTCFEVNGEYYAVWSQRQFVPVDQGAWLYIAKLDPKQPWRLITDPVVICKPEFSWENNHTFVVEGPYPLMIGGKVFLTYSGALVDATYAVGLLIADKSADLLNPASWAKINYPLLHSRSVPGEYGPGHNSYVIDDLGIIWNAYHARPGVKGPRSAGLRRVHFDIDGYPRLDLTEDKDLNQDLAQVSLSVVVRANLRE